MIMIAVPAYLTSFADSIRTAKETLSFDIKCTCGCGSFKLVKNSHTAEEKKTLEEYEQSLPKTGWHTIYGGIDENGKPYSYIRKLFFFKKYIEFPPEPFFVNIKVVKAICESCKKEIILFDSRLNGYDSQESTDEELEYDPYFKKSNSQCCGVSVKLEQFEDENIDPNHFSWIWIYKKDGSRKTVFFDEETA
ncbi:MAG: hypothetical protein IKS27_03785 [Oscillospiraceae bacterium]|nr:hypothetical protein [Oscillospiraceae bacterium]